MPRSPLETKRVKGEKIAVSGEGEKLAQEVTTLKNVSGTWVGNVGKKESAEHER